MQFRTDPIAKESTIPFQHFDNEEKVVSEIAQFPREVVGTDIEPQQKDGSVEDVDSVAIHNTFISTDFPPPLLPKSLSMPEHLASREEVALKRHIDALFYRPQTTQEDDATKANELVSSVRGCTLDDAVTDCQQLHSPLLPPSLSTDSIPQHDIRNDVNYRVQELLFRVEAQMPFNDKSSALGVAELVEECSTSMMRSPPFRSPRPFEPPLYGESSSTLFNAWPIELKDNEWNSPRLDDSCGMSHQKNVAGNETSPLGPSVPFHDVSELPSKNPIPLCLPGPAPPPLDEEAFISSASAGQSTPINQTMESVLHSSARPGPAPMNDCDDPFQLPADSAADATAEPGSSSPDRLYQMRKHKTHFSLGNSTPNGRAVRKEGFALSLGSCPRVYPVPILGKGATVERADSLSRSNTPGDECCSPSFPIDDKLLSVSLRTPMEFFAAGARAGSTSRLQYRLSPLNPWNGSTDAIEGGTPTSQQDYDDRSVYRTGDASNNRSFGTLPPQSAPRAVATVASVSLTKELLARQGVKGVGTNEAPVRLDQNNVPACEPMTVHRMSLRDISSESFHQSDNEEYVDGDALTDNTRMPTGQRSTSDLGRGDVGSAVGERSNALPTEDLTEDLLEKIPRDEIGNLMSVGSIAHLEGNCKACVFFHNPQKGCKNGLYCLFCHFPHAPKKRIRLSKRKRAEMRAATQDTLDPATPLPDTPAQLDGVRQSLSSTCFDSLKTPVVPSGLRSYLNTFRNSTAQLGSDMSEALSMDMVPMPPRGSVDNFRTPPPIDALQAAAAAVRPSQRQSDCFGVSPLLPNSGFATRQVGQTVPHPSPLVVVGPHNSRNNDFVASSSVSSEKSSVEVVGGLLWEHSMQLSPNVLHPGVQNAHALLLSGSPSPLKSPLPTPVMGDFPLPASSFCKFPAQSNVTPSSNTQTPAWD